MLVQSHSSRLPKGPSYNYHIANSLGAKEFLCLQVRLHARSQQTVTNQIQKIINRKMKPSVSQS